MQEEQLIKLYDQLPAAGHSADIDAEWEGKTSTEILRACAVDFCMIGFRNPFGDAPLMFIFLLI